MNGNHLEESVRVVQEMQAPQGFLTAVLRRCGLVDGYATVETPIGTVYAAMGEHGVTSVMEASDDDEFERRYHERFGRRAERCDALAPALKKAIADAPRAKVDLSECNAFQRAVLETTRNIPVGTIRPYAWIAREIGHPGAVRAVGTALAHNPVPLVIPCHRVVRSDGEIGQYALGTDEKVTLLEHEGVDIPEVRRRILTRRFWSHEGEDTYCYPFCFSTRQVQRGRLIEFRTAQEALSHGLRPCETCHPPLAA